MQQLQCNGILEGIRISRKGYPTRIHHSQFLHRYSCLNKPHERTELEISQKTDDETTEMKQKCQQIFDQIGLDINLYRIGFTKCLLKPGVINLLEKQRDIASEQKVLQLQNIFRQFLAKLKNIFEYLVYSLIHNLLQGITCIY